jgi:two-component system sensor kinase FixL
MEDAGRLSELLLEQSPACHWMVSADGVFERIGGDASSVFGKPAAQLVGQSVSQALGQQVSAAWKGRFARAFQGETLSLRERHGKAIWHITVFPVRVTGEIRHAGGLASESTPWSTAEQELRHTVLDALKAQDFERSKVARFLHDSVGQNLTALGLQLDLVRMDLESISPGTCAHVSQIQQLLGGMMEEVREFSYHLNPSIVERAGLRPALDRLVGGLRTRFAGTLRVSVDPSLKLDQKTASAMYQIAQEALENSVQHSSCSTIEIALKSTRTSTVLEVRDNGRGFDTADPVGGCRGLGLLSMEHYAAQAGLDLSIDSNWKAGTTVKAAARGGLAGKAKRDLCRST